MNMIQIQDKLIASVTRSRRPMHFANAQASARKALMAKGYSESEARAIVSDAIDMADLLTNAA